MTARILVGDCREVLPTLAADSIHACVTDPPYGLGFMGKDWDHGIPGVHFWVEVMRVLKPGAHLVAFGGTRTFHRLTSAIEDAGFEIRDCLGWLYGSGFPKSLDVSKAIDKAAGVNRPRVVGGVGTKGGLTYSAEGGYVAGEAISGEAIRWNGWGTALKPAWEPIILARKPLIGTVAANVQAHGTGALNIGTCRIGSTVETWPASRSYAPGQLQPGGKGETMATGPVPARRWPANILHDGSEEVLAVFPESKDGVAVGGNGKASSIYGTALDRSGGSDVGYGGSGSAARFFYCAKASREDRNAGLSGFDPKTTSDGRAVAADNAYQRGKSRRENTHPTVKPTDLMQWLCRLITPPGGTVLDPFMGSGSTGKAADREGFDFIGIELDPEYAEIAKARIQGDAPLFAQVSA